jgi:uroporphyrinogen-III synthase
MSSACCARLGSLSGFTVAVTADRRAEEQIVLLEHLGAGVIPAPMVHTSALADVAPMEQATRRLLADPCDVLIASTGLGMRGWFSAARSWGLDEPLRDVLSRAQIAVRGSKAAAPVLEGKLSIWHHEQSERLDNLVRTVVAAVPAGAHIALQLSGEAPEQALALLEAAHMRVTVVPVYQWTPPADMTTAERIVNLVAVVGVDAVTFTSSPAVRNFLDIARHIRVLPDVVSAFQERVVAVCVGPATRDALVDVGITTARAPETGRLGLMVRELAVAMQARHHHVEIDGLDVVIQGGLVATRHGEVELQGREREVFAALADRPASVVSPAALLRDVWERGADDGVVAKTVSRLRTHLEPLGLTIRNVVKRGYTLTAAEAPYAAAAPL